METSLPHHAHEGRPDLTGEHKAGDAGQLVLFFVFITFWALDSFIFNWTNFLAESISLWIRIPFAVIVLLFGVYLARASTKKVFGEVREMPRVIDEGIYSVCRHPMYLSAMLLYLGLVLFTFSLISAGLFVIIAAFYLYICRYEERLLLERFGPEYEIYMKKVPMLFPIKF